MKAKDLTSTQQSDFVEAFYFHPDNPLNAERDCSDGNSYPWGAPWFYAEEEELVGNTIKEMAYNYFEKVRKDIIEVLKTEREQTYE